MKGMLFGIPCLLLVAGWHFVSAAKPVAGRSVVTLPANTIEDDSWTGVIEIPYIKDGKDSDALLDQRLDVGFRAVALLNECHVPAYGCGVVGVFNVIVRKRDFLRARSILVGDSKHCKYPLGTKIN